jgi:hypothetical protein
MSTPTPTLASNANLIEDRLQTLVPPIATNVTNCFVAVQNDQTPVLQTELLTVANDGRTLLHFFAEFTGASSGDSLPSGAVAFFNLPQGASASSTCPTNWQTINGIDGRFILPSPSSTPPPAPGALGGAAPWTNYQAPTHTHTLSASTNVASTDFLPGRGLNHDLAKPGAQPVSGTLAANTSPIVPFVVLLACEKTQLPLSGAPTPGMSVYLGSPQCLNGWAYTPTAPGRFIVSIGDAGTFGWTNGAASYTSVGGASSTHTHTVSGSATVSNHDTDLAHGSGLHLGKSGGVSFSGPSTSATLALPFMTFNLCTYTGQM